MRHLLLGAALLFATPALACPMADAAAHQEAAAKVKAATGTKITLAIAGMHCGSCSDKITAKLTTLPGVNAAATDYQAGTAEVAVDASKINAETLVSAIKELGFEAKVTQS